MKILPLLAVPLLAASVHAVEVTEEGGRVSIANDRFRLSYQLQSGEYSGTDLASGITVFSGAKFTVDEVGWRNPDAPARAWKVAEVDDAFGRGKTLSVTETPPGPYRPIKTLHLSVYDDLPYAVLGFSVTNHRKIPARICRIGVLEQAQLFRGKKLEEPRLLRGGAGSERNRVEHGLEISCFNNLLLTGKIGGQRHSMVAGGLHYRSFLRALEIDAKRNRFTVTIEDPQGKLVEPGTTYDAVDTVFLDFTTADPFVSLERYGLAMREANQADPKAYDYPTLCGWLASSGHYGEGRPINNSKELVAQMELARGSGILDYTPVAIRLEPDYYCNRSYGDTQQGWWDDEHWAKYGSLVPPYETFGKFCGRIRELGGIPFTYIQTNMPSNDFALAHPEWMLGEDISRLHAEHRHHMPFVKYDFTDPGFQAHTLAMWKRLDRQGLMGIKFDYPESGWCLDGGFDDPTYTTTDAYRKIFQLCREGLGEDGYIHERNLGEYGTPRLDVTAGIVDLQRVWNDSSHFEPEMAARMGLRWYKCRSVFGYYPDGKSFKKMDVDARRTMLSQVGLLSGRLELGTTFGTMTGEEMHDLTRLYPVLRGTRSFRPVDMLMEGRTDPSVYAYRVNDDWSQVILCNNHDRANPVSSPLSGDQADTGSLGHDPGGSYYIHDFWNDEFLGEFDGKDSLTRLLKPHQALTYSVHRKQDHPQFISTNRHILQGLMELAGVRWDEASGSYSGVASVIGGEPFAITLANNGYRPAKATAEGAAARFEPAGEGLTRLVLTAAETAEVEWALVWEKDDDR